MAVPEAAMDKDHGVVFGQDEIGLAGERAVERAVHGEALAHAVEHGAQRKLGFRVPTADGAITLKRFSGVKTSAIWK